MNTTHLHKYKQEGNFYVCECGKKILKFKEEDGKKIGVRSNGRKYTKKSNQNRFFFPDEYMKFEDSLKPRSKHTVKCLFNTGARIQEMQLVLVQDFIYNPKGRSRIILRHTKTKARKGEFGSGKLRDVPLSKTFSKYLHKFIQENNLKEKDNFKILSDSALNIAMKKTAKNIKLKNPEDFSAHTMRKTLETWLMALNVGDMKIIAHLGHDLKTAASHYVSPDIFSWEDKTKMRQILGDLYLQ